jgi:hypothetical protein
MAAADPVMGRYKPILMAAAAGTVKKRHKAAMRAKLFRKGGKRRKGEKAKRDKARFFL